MKDKHQKQHQLQQPALTSNKARVIDQKVISNSQIKNNKSVGEKAAPYFITHTRAEAISKGFLLEVSDTARKVGFPCAVALTRAVWDDCVAWDEKDKNKDRHQNERDRLFEVLGAAMLAWRFHNKGARCTFDIYRVPRTGKDRRLHRVTLSLCTSSALISPLHITIMNLNEI